VPGSAEERLAQKGDGPAQRQEEQLRRLNAGLLRRRDRKGGKPRLAPVRELHGRVFLLASGGLDTPIGLQLADALARRGAPLIQLVYAVQCDLADLRSIDSFVKKWEALLQPGGRRDGPGSEPMLDPRTAKSDGVDASSLQAMSSPARRLDSVIFLPSRSPYSLTCKRSSVRYPAQENKASSHNTADAVNDDLEVETGHALALGRLHLILSLVPSLTTLPRERDIRIVNAVGPWYAAATAITSRIKPATTETKGDASIPAGFTNRELDWKSSSSGPLARSLHFSPWSPHLPTALTDLTWLGLSTYLQRRLDVLAGELTGTVMHSAAVNAAEISSDRKSRSNIRILTVSLGFERSQLLATFLPPPSLFEESLPMRTSLGSCFAPSCGSRSSHWLFCSFDRPLMQRTRCCGPFALRFGREWSSCRHRKPESRATRMRVRSRLLASFARLKRWYRADSISKAT